MLGHSGQDELLPPEQLCPAAIKTRVGKMGQPVAQIDVAAVCAQINFERQMPVPENEIIKMLALQNFFAVNHKPLFVLAQKSAVCVACNAAAVAR